jgi:cyclopropane-fatty-acyl-phospholipid synthase
VINTNKGSWKRRYDRILKIIQRQFSEHVQTPFMIKVWTGKSYLFGKGDPGFTISINDRSGLSATSQFDELKICEAYMAESLDFDGNMLHVLKLRDSLSDAHPFNYLWRRLMPFIIGGVATNRKAIASHYEFDNDFYLSFMDKSRCYSHALFKSDKEPLETAMKRKLDFAIESCNIKPGDRVLDVGGGWGTFTEHAGLKGINVTSLTIAKNSEKYIGDLIKRKKLPCRVINTDFFEHRVEEPYDAIVILGVIEHLPDYRGVLKQFQRLLKPGGRVYLDASAYRKKHDHPSFVARYIFPGDHSSLCLHDFLREVAKSRMDVVEVYNDRRSYYLTSKKWVENLEANRDEIVKRWGEMLYRRFRLYLWGVVNGFHNMTLDAYRVVLEFPE